MSNLPISLIIDIFWMSILRKICQIIVKVLFIPLNSWAIMMQNELYYSIQSRVCPSHYSAPKAKILRGSTQFKNKITLSSNTPNQHFYPQKTKLSPSKKIQTIPKLKTLLSIQHWELFGSIKIHIYNQIKKNPIRFNSNILFSTFVLSLTNNF